jgi:hypothetical protein
LIRKPCFKDKANLAIYRCDSQAHTIESSQHTWKFTMKVTLIGATGFVGSAVLSELLQRGHQVTVLARTPAKVLAQPGLTVMQGSALDAAQVQAASQGQDAVVSAYNPGWTEPDLYNLFLQGSRTIVEGVRASGTRRLLVVGGAGSLFVAPGVQLVDTPEFPAEWKAGALAARDALNELRNESALDWTFLSPPILLQPGDRTGQYRLGTEAPLMNGDQPGSISVADLAVAIVDELENPHHLQQRFTVAN